MNNYSKENINITLKKPKSGNAFKNFFTARLILRMMILSKKRKG